MLMQPLREPENMTASDIPDLTLYGDVYSGNCYKLILCCHALGLTFNWQYVDILKGKSRTAQFLRLNPNGRIPLLLTHDHQSLAESNAILSYLAAGSTLIPSARWPHAQMLQWQFFEQYSHEPAIAVARYIQHYLGLPPNEQARHAACLPKGYAALDVMEQHLADHDFFVAGQYSLADISLYAYTHVADQGGFSLQAYPHIRGWLTRVQAQPGHISMAQAAQRYQPA